MYAHDSQRLKKPWYEAQSFTDNRSVTRCLEMVDPCLASSGEGETMPVAAHPAGTAIDSGLAQNRFGPLRLPVAAVWMPPPPLLGKT